jgi:hypothetical protein
MGALARKCSEVTAPFLPPPPHSYNPGMSKRGSTSHYWPWTIRAFALFLPALYTGLSGASVFNLARGPSPTVLIPLIVIALVTCVWYRRKVTK